MGRSQRLWSLFREEAGTATLNAFGFLVLVVALAGGLLALTVAGSKSRADRIDRTRARTEALQLARAAMVLLAEEAPEGSDHPNDPLAAGIHGVDVTDASSAFDPNWIRSDLIDKTAWKDWLLPGRTGMAFAQDRSDHGFSTDATRRWADWFRLDLINQRMTVWCPWPVNTGDEIALRDAYFERTADAASADRFRDSLRKMRQEKKLMTPEVLRTLSAPHDAAIAGVFTTQAPWNANALPEDQLRALLSYPPFSIPDPPGAASLVVSARTTGRIVAGRLSPLLSLPPDHPLFAYLGTVTLVWRTQVRAGDETLISYWVRTEPSGSGGKPSFTPWSLEWRPEKHP